MEVLVSGNPRDAKKASITGSGRLQECKILANPALRTPHYYGQLAVSLWRASPYTVSKFNSPNADTPFIRTLSMALSVSMGVEKDWVL